MLVTLRFLVVWKFAVNKNRRGWEAIPAKAPSLLEETEHVINFYVDDVANSREIDPLTKAQGRDHPSLRGGIAIAPGVESPVLLLCIARFIELVIESAGVVRDLEEFRQFLDECDGGAIYNASVLLMEDDGAISFDDLVLELCGGYRDNGVADVVSMERGSYDAYE